MSRLLFFIAIAAVVYLLLRSYRKNLPKDDTPVAPEAEKMVRCAQCGVHLPHSESLVTDGRFFCCAAHQNDFRAP
jgi:uncharacterized protein